MAGLDEGLRDLRIENIPFSCHGPFDCVIELAENLNQKRSTRATCFLRSETSGEFFVMTTFSSLLDSLIVNLINESTNPPPPHVANYGNDNMPLIQRLFGHGHNASERNESKNWCILQVNRLMRSDQIKAYVEKNTISMEPLSVPILSVRAGLYCQEIETNGSLLTHENHEKCMNAALLEIPNNLHEESLKSLIHDCIGERLCLIKDAMEFPQEPDPAARLGETEEQQATRLAHEREIVVKQQRDFFKNKYIKNNETLYHWYSNSKKVTPKPLSNPARGRCLIVHDNIENWTKCYEGLAVYKIISPKLLKVGPGPHEQWIERNKFTNDGHSYWIFYGIGRVVAMYSEWSKDDALISDDLLHSPQNEMKKTHSTVLVVDIAIKEFESILGCKLKLLSDVNPAGEK